MFKGVEHCIAISIFFSACVKAEEKLNDLKKPQPTVKNEQCEPHEDALQAVKKEKQVLEQECKSSSISQENKSAKEGELEALAEIERKLEEERLKVLFVDVNTVMETIELGMDKTANWLDGYFADDEQGKNKAKAWGNVVFAWEPREGEMYNFPIKFKVRAKLPNLKNKMELVLSDNEQEDFNTLPYETVRPEAYKSSQRSLGAAVRFLHSTSENVKVSSRIGTGDGTIYARSAVRYGKKFWHSKVTLNAESALEYYVTHGWGARVLLDTGYAFTPRNELRFNMSYRDLQSYDSIRWRKGLYHIGATGEKSAIITGVTVTGEVEPEYEANFYKTSVRYRFNALRKWIFFEIEPFVEFEKPDMATDFIRDRGITFRFEAHYGFL